MTDAPQIEIEELREAGEDGGDLMGYYARGHHDPADFERAANKYSGAEYGWDIRYVDAKNVSHVWYRTVQMEGQPKGTYEYRATQPGTKGAWKATVCSSVEIYRTKKARREIREYDRGYQEGLSRALGFLLAQLEWGGNLAEKATIEQRRDIAKELRAAFERDHESMNKQQAA